jgi:hypothetical protein
LQRRAASGRSHEQKESRYELNQTDSEDRGLAVQPYTVKLELNEDGESLLIGGAEE